MSTFEDLRALMRTPVNKDTMSKLLTGRFRAPSGVESRVDDLLAQAKMDAENSGRTIEEVLREYGFEVGDEVPAAPAAPAAAPPPPPGAAEVSVEQEPQAPVAEPAAQEPDSPGEAPDTQAVFDLLAPLDPAELRPFLVGDALRELGARAAFLGLISQEAADGLEASGQWQELLLEGLSLTELAQLVSSSAYFPHVHEGQDLEDLVLSKGLLRFRDLASLRGSAEASARPTWQVALEDGFLPEASLVELLCELYGLEAGSPPKRFAKGLLESFPGLWVRYLHLVPLRRSKGVLQLAVARPLPAAWTARLAEELGGEVELRLVGPQALEALREEWLRRWREQNLDPEDGEPTPSATDAAAQAWVFDESAERLPAPKLVEALMLQAREARATDIHLEASDTGGRARFRIDGICQTVLEMPAARYKEVISRVKVMADMDVTERRRPQDGNLVVDLGAGRQSMRISTVPSVRGEKLAIRLADTQRVQARLEELGLMPTHLELLRELSARPFGMLLATGPVGSGKTTTLYSCLHELDRRHFNVMSIEDPVEIRLDGVTQLEVNYSLGFDFASGLRALLRQDPDAILLGEIRDHETAQIAVRASMTGLRVYSTLHTNDSTGAVTALRNFQLSPHLIASSLQGVIAQRLLRRLCPSCSEPRKPREEDFAQLGIDELPQGFRAWRARGCDACLGTGYQGRVGVFEIFPITRTVREMILHGASEREIRDHARGEGLVSLQEDGLVKVGQGLTSLYEFRRVLNF